MSELNLKTPKEVVETVIFMRDCGFREATFDWKNINLGKIKKHTLIKICCKYGKVSYKLHGFLIKFIYS